MTRNLTTLFALALPALMAFLPAQSALAQEEAACPEVHLDNQVEQIPVWDQQDSFLCYSYSAAVLIDAYRVTHGEPNLGSFSSPLALAAQTINYSQSLSRRSSFWGGVVEQSLRVANTEGTCNAQWIHDGVGPSRVGEVLARLQAFHKKGRENPAMRPEISQEVQNYFLARGGQKNELLTTAAIESLLKLDSGEFSAKILASLCHPQKRIPLPEPQTQDRGYSTVQVSLREKLPQLLAEKTPVAVEFCAEVVTTPGYSPGYDGMCSRHYVVAVGQRMNKGVCQIQVRDSQCNQYRFKPGQEACVNGQHWIDRSSFISNAYSLTWL